MYQYIMGQSQGILVEVTLYSPMLSGTGFTVLIPWSVDHVLSHPIL